MSELFQGSSSTLQIYVLPANAPTPGQFFLPTTTRGNPDLKPDPLSMTAECRFIRTVSRTGWETTTRGSCTLSCTKTDWIVADSVQAHYNG